MTTRQTVTITAAAAAASAATGLLVRRRQQDAAATGSAQAAGATVRDDPTADNRTPGRWRSVTIFRSPEEVLPDGRPPGPLAELGDLVDVSVKLAPGDRGTELSARLRNGELSGPGALGARLGGDDPRQAVRTALRQSKQLLETGEILRVDPASHGRRSGWIGGKLIDLTTRRAGGEGLL